MAPPSTCRGGDTADGPIAGTAHPRLPRINTVRLPVASDWATISVSSHVGSGVWVTVKRTVRPPGRICGNRYFSSPFFVSGT